MRVYCVVAVMGRKNDKELNVAVGVNIEGNEESWEDYECERRFYEAVDQRDLGEICPPSPLCEPRPK